MTIAAAIILPALGILIGYLLGRRDGMDTGMLFSRHWQAQAARYERLAIVATRDAILAERLAEAKDQVDREAAFVCREIERQEGDEDAEFRC